MASPGTQDLESGLRHECIKQVYIQSGEMNMQGVFDLTRQPGQDGLYRASFTQVPPNGSFVVHVRLAKSQNSNKRNRCTWESLDARWINPGAKDRRSAKGVSQCICKCVRDRVGGRLTGFLSLCHFVCLIAVCRWIPDRGEGG